MDSTDQQILNRLNKHESRRANTLNTKFPENESITAALIVYGNEIWMDAILIPRTGANLNTVKALSNGSIYTDATTSVPVVRRYIHAATTSVNASRLVFYNANLIDVIPSLFLTTKEYTIRLYKNVAGVPGVEIPYKSGEWDVDNTSGILRFYKSADYVLTMLGALPPFVSFWRYVGRRMDTVLYAATATAESALPIVGGTMLGDIDLGTNDLNNVGSIDATSIDIGTGNATIDAAGNVECQNLTVNGTLTTIESQTILVGDNTLVINNGPMGSRDAGYLIERYVTDVVADTPTSSNVSQATTSTTIQLNGGSSAINDFYVGTYIKITASVVFGAANQVRLITGYVGATKIATIDQAWTRTPSATSSYSLYSNRLVGQVYTEADEMFRFGYYQRDSQTALDPVRYANTRADYNIAARLLVGTDNLGKALEDGQARIGTTLITTDKIVLNADVQNGEGVQLRRRNGAFTVNRGDPEDVASLYWEEANDGNGGNWMMRNSGIDFNVAAAFTPVDNAIAVHYTSPSSGTYNLLSDAAFSYDSDTSTMSAPNATIAGALRVSGIIMGENQILSETVNYPLILDGNGTGLVEFVCAPVARGPYMAINYSQVGAPTLNGYLQFARGSSTAASIYWNETLDRFTCGLDTDQQRIARLGSGLGNQRIPIYDSTADTLIFDPTFYYDTLTGTLNVGNITSTTLTFGVDDGVSFIKNGNIFTDAGMTYNDTTNKLTLVGALESASITLPGMTIINNIITTTEDVASMYINLATDGFFTVASGPACFTDDILLNSLNGAMGSARDIFITFARGIADPQYIEWNETDGRFRIGGSEDRINIARIDNSYVDTYVPFYSSTTNKLLATNVTYDSLTSALNSVNQTVTTALSVAQVAINTNTITTVAGTDQDLVIAADGVGVIQISNTISYSPTLMTLNIGSASTPTNDVAIDIYRGLSTTARIGWNETSDSFECGTTSDLLPVGRVAVSVTNQMIPYYDTTAKSFVSDGRVSYNPATRYMTIPAVVSNLIQFSNYGDPALSEGAIVYLDANTTTTFAGSSFVYKNSRLGVGAVATTHKVEVTGALYSTTGLITGPSLTINSTSATTNAANIVSNTFNIISSSGNSIMYWRFGNTTETTGDAALAVFLANNTSTINHYLAANNSQITYFCANNGTVAIGTTSNANTRKLLVNGSFEASSIYLTNATSTRIPYFTTGGQLSVSTTLTWNETSKYLGVNKAIPTCELDVVGAANITGNVSLAGLTTNRIMVVAASGLLTTPSAMRYIALTGNVSIGTGTDPTEKLEVGGTVSATGLKSSSLVDGGVLFSTANVVTTNAAQLFWKVSNSSLGIGTADPSYNIHNTGTTNTNSLYINTVLFSDSGRNITPNNIATTGNKLVWNNTTARLGVNVAVPSTPLDVKAEGSNTSAQQIKSSADAVLFSFDQGTTDQGILRVRDASGVEKIRFNSEADSFINGISAGLLIGTATNTNLRKLLVAGSTESTGILYVSQADDATSANSGSIQSAGGMSLAKNLVIGGLTSGSIPYINASKAVSESTVVPLFWDATNSRLGVGTNSPGYRISSNGTIYTATGFAGANDTGLTVISAAVGTQLMNLDITPSAGNLSCLFRLARNTVTTGDTAFVIYVPGTSTINHNLSANNDNITYFGANNGTVVIGGTTNPSGYKLLVTGTFSASGAVTLSNYTINHIPYFGTGGLITGSANFTWDGSTQVITGALTVSSTGLFSGVLSLTSAATTTATAGALVITNGISVGDTIGFNGFTAGSIPFIGATKLLSQSNGQLFWDITNSRLGVGNTSPAYKVSVTGSLQATTGLVIGNNTGLTALSVAGGTQILNLDITPSGGSLTCQFRIGRSTSTTGDMLLALHSPGSATLNHSFGTNNNQISYMCGNNGTVAIGTTANSLGYKLLVSGSFSASGAVTLSNYTVNHIPYFGIGGLITGSANFTWNGSTLAITGALTASGAVTLSNYTVNHIPYFGASGLITGSANFTWNETTLAITGAATISTSLTLGASTATRIPYFGTGGLISDSANLTWTNASSLLTVTGAISASTSAYVGASSIVASAVLQADSTTKGALIPRMSNAQKLAISSPATGLLVYDTDLSEISYYDGAIWNSSNTLAGTPQPITSGSITSLQQLKINKYLASIYNNSAHSVIFNKYTHGATTAIAAYFGGVYSPIQNRIYFVPHDQAAQTTWHYYDCRSGLVVSYVHGATVSNSGYRGGVYVPEVNRIYLIPNAQASVSIWHYIDCSNGTVVSYTHGVTAVSGGYAGGAYMTTLGRIYMAPYAQGSNANWHYINALTTPPTATAYAQNNGGATTVSSTTAYMGAIHIPLYDRIYFLPAGQSTVSSWHYVTSAGLILSYTNAAITANVTIRGGAYSPINDRIYLTISQQAGNNSTWHYISPSTNTITAYTGQTVTSQLYSGAVYSPTKNIIYHVPYANLGTLAYTNCATATMTTYTNPYSLNNGAYQGGVYSPTENKIIFIPYSQGQVSTWNWVDEFSSYPVDRGMMSNSTFNKF